MLELKWEKKKEPEEKKDDGDKDKDKSEDKKGDDVQAAQTEENTNAQIEWYLCIFVNF